MMFSKYYLYSDKALNILSLHFSQLTKYLNDSILPLRI